MSRYRCLLTFLALVLSGVVSAQHACPFCNMQGQTLTMEANQASFVLFGRLTNPKLQIGADGTEAGTTDLVIDEVVKSHAFIKDKRVVVLPKYVPVEPGSKMQFLIFCELFKDRIDPYRGDPVKDKSIVAYLKGAIEIKDKDLTERIEYFFHYLDHPDIVVNTDAYKEFANADGKTVMAMVQKADRVKLRDKLVKWLEDKETPAYRYGLYGYLLGLCGTDKDAEVLVTLLRDPERGLLSGVDGILAGYIALRPKEGWQYLLGILGDEKKEFTRRYAALRAVRFFWDERPGLIPQKEVLSAIELLLDQGDIADLAIEDLRKWKQWEMLDKILPLAGRKSHDTPIVQRSILRFALSCPPENKKAAEFLEKQRQRDPDRVRDAEELLKFETPIKSGGAGL